MWTIKQPSKIILGENCTHDYKFPNKCLIVTSKGAKSRGWLDHINQSNYIIYDQVESNPSMNTVEKILQEFENETFDSVIGLGGGSVLDVTKFLAYKMKKSKILIPTTFGSGSEVTRISVLKVDGKKKSFHDDALFADVSLASRAAGRAEGCRTPAARPLRARWRRPGAPAWSSLAAMARRSCGWRSRRAVPRLGSVHGSTYWPHVRGRERLHE